jgi:hypothetical protein
LSKFLIQGGERVGLLLFRNGDIFVRCAGLAQCADFVAVKRFSEDCDLAIYRSFFGMEGELGKKERTKLRKISCSFIKEKLSLEIDAMLQKHGTVDYSVIVPQSTISDADPQDLYVKYQSLFPELDYIRNQVKLEIGCRSLRGKYLSGQSLRILQRERLIFR